MNSAIATYASIFNEKSVYYKDNKTITKDKKPQYILQIKSRNDGIEYFFKYKDGTGRGIFFKVANEPKQGQKSLLSPHCYI